MIGPALPDPVRILVIEDSSADAELVCEALECAEVHEVLVSPTLADGLRILSDADVDAVLLDLSLPDAFGIETLRQLMEAFPEMVVVIFTGNESEEVGLLAARAGAEDYIPKSAAPSSLRRTLLYAVERAKLRKAVQESEKNAEYATTMRRFVDIVSHEFKTPISVLTTATDLIRKHVAADDGCNALEIEKNLNRISRAIKRQNGLVARLLAIGKQDAGKKALSSKLYTLEQIIPDLISDIEAEHGAEIELDIEGLGISILCDQEALSHILENLIQNAFKYGAEPIIVRSRFDGQNLWLWVRDHGGGVPEAQAEQIWRRFQRGDGAGGPGVGVGLSVVRFFAEAHGGDANHCVPEDGGPGSVFWVRLPIVAAPEPIMAQRGGLQ